MAKKSKTKEVKKTLKTKEVTAPVAKKAETVEPEVIEPEVVEAQKTGEYPPKPAAPEKDEKVEKETTIDPPASKNPEPITPEVVEDKEKKKEEKPIPSISAGLNKLANGDRLDHNHAVDLMKMVHEGFVVNPATPPELGKAMKRQFDTMALVELMFYNAQVENDLQQLGIKVNTEQFAEIERIARESFGIPLKGLPVADNPKQLMINFSESIPEPVKEQVKKDVSAAKEEVPKPDVNLPETTKLKALRTIFSQIGGGIGNNLNRGIDWGRIAFGFDDKEKKSVVLAKLLSNDFRTTLTNGLSGMVKGKLGHDHSVIGAHAVLHQWLPTYADQDIAEIVQVCLAYKEEANCKDYAEKTGKKLNLDNSLALMSRDVIAGCASQVIDGILNNKDQVIVDYADKLGKVAVNTVAIRKSMVASYGDSDQILKDKLQEIAKYYVKPIMRLSKYIDKSAYSTALA